MVKFLRDYELKDLHGLHGQLSFSFDYGSEEASCEQLWFTDDHGNQILLAHKIISSKESTKTNNNKES
jgi:hypothetical protein